MTILIARFMFWLSGVYSNFIFMVRKFFGKVVSEDEMNATIETMKSFDFMTLSAWLRQTFAYANDGWIDYYKNPLHFLYDKNGDCDDFAEFCSFTLPKLGWKNVSVVIVMGKDLNGHAICVGTPPESEAIIGMGNWPYQVYQKNDLNEIGLSICGKMKLEFLFALRYDADGKYLEGVVVD